MGKKFSKLAKAAGAIGAAYLGSKMLGKKAMPTDTGDLGSEMANDTALARGTRKAMLSKSSNIGKLSGFKYNKANDMGIGFDMYGNPEGAKYGKMIKASKGTAVMSRGCKLGRHKKTKIV